MLDILVKHIIPALLITYIGFGAMLFFFQRNYIFYPAENDFGDCPALADTETVHYGTTRAYFKEAGETLVVLYHGNAETTCSRAWYVSEFFEPFGFSYLLVEYAGFAGDDLKPSAEAIYQNAADTAVFLKNKDFSKIVIMAESIGSAPAAYHASLAKTKIDAIILTTPFTSLESVAQYHYPIYPVSLLLRERLETIRWLRETDAAVYLIHGTGDSLVPSSESGALHATLGHERASLTLVEGADHNDIYEYPEWSAHIKTLLTHYATSTH